MKKIYPINLIKVTKIENKNCSVQNEKKKTLFTIKTFFYRTYTYFLVGMTQREREEGASHTLLTVRFITYQHHSLLPNISLWSRPTHAFWSQVIDFFYGFCINNTDLQKITKTEVVGLQKLKWLKFDCCINFNRLRYTWTDPLSRTFS